MTPLSTLKTFLLESHQLGAAIQEHLNLKERVANYFYHRCPSQSSSSSCDPRERSLREYKKREGNSSHETLGRTNYNFVDDGGDDDIKHTGYDMTIRKPMAEYK